MQRGRDRHHRPDRQVDAPGRDDQGHARAPRSRPAPPAPAAAAGCHRGEVGREQQVEDQQHGRSPRRRRGRAAAERRPPASRADRVPATRLRRAVASVRLDRAAEPVRRGSPSARPARGRARDGGHDLVSLISSPVSTPTTAPSRSTSTRSAPSTTSSSSEEISTTPSPCRGQLVDQRLDLGLGADVDAPGRLVEQQHPRVQAEHPGQQDLLLVAAGQLADLLVRAGDLDPQPLDEASTISSQRRSETKPARVSRGSAASTMLSRTDRSADDALGLAVLGDHADAGRDGGGRRPAPGRRLPPTLSVPAVDRVAPKMAFAVSLRPEPSRPARPDHLARVHVDVDPGQRVPAGQADRPAAPARRPRRCAPSPKRVQPCSRTSATSRPSIVATSPSRSVSATSPVCTRRPSRSTVTCWQSRKTSSSLCVT